MRKLRIVPRIAAAVLLAAAAREGLAQELPQETSFSVTGRYTAQRKPRVAVLEFEDTNSNAQNQKYGSSVQAMLVTYFKRKSQLVVVERQKLGNVIEEWKRNQKGLTNLQPEDPTAKELLEKIDAIVIGSVTLLDDISEVSTTQGTTSGGKTRSGRRIEIDAKLLSRSDGRIIAAAQRDGPVNCLRAIVERLGVALEQEYLRPYFGQLKIKLSEPEQVKVLLTPILLDSALDEEKPPVERSATIISEPKQDIVESWITDPTTYTVKNLLSGWYSMRLERPGYELRQEEASRWEAYDDGRVRVYDRTSQVPLERLPPGLRRYVVHVDPLATETLDIDTLGFTFRKLGGSLAPQVKRQYLDEDFNHRPRRTVLIATRLEINNLEPPTEYGDDEDCDLFEEKLPYISDYGRTVITSGQKFDFEGFKGGELFFEDYKNGDILPAGEYDMIIWEPSYHIHQSGVTIRDQDKEKLVRTSLVRETSSVSLATTGSRPASRVALEGEATRHRVELPLDFEAWMERESLPVDVYSATTDIQGLTGWRRNVLLAAESSAPPFFDVRDEKRGPILRNVPQRAGEEQKNEEAKQEKKQEVPRLRIKTRLTIGGRLSALGAPPDPLVHDVYIDRDLSKILDRLLYTRQEDEEEGRGALSGALASAGKKAIEYITTPILENVAASSPTGPPPSAPAPEVTTPVEVESLPRDEEALRALLASRLEDLELLVLDDKDLARLRTTPEVTALLARYVENGGALFAFASEEGDYARVLGAPLVLKEAGKPTEKFELAPGEVSGIALRAGGKKAKVKAKRVLPQLERLDSNATWRVIAFGKNRRDVRILERGYRDQGGYVAVWLDDPESVRGRRGGTVPQVEEVRSRVEKYVLDWARFLMQRRYGQPAKTATGRVTPN
jgi:curli biogenesis system outer membrane secretion channel CsgG